MNAFRFCLALTYTFFAFASTAVSAGATGPVWRVEYATSGEARVPATGAPRLAVGPAGIYAYGFAEPGLLGSVVVKLDPTTANVDWSAVAPLETERGAVYDRVIVLPGGPLSLAGSISQLDAKGDVLWSIPRSTDHFSEYGGAAAGVPNTGWIQSAQFTGTWTSGANFDIRLLSSASGETLDRMSLPMSHLEPPSCRMLEFVNVDVNTSYVANDCIKGKLVKLQLSPLTDQWTLPASTPEIDSLLSMRADASGAYIIGVREGNSFLRKIASDNASSLWTVVRPIGTLERISIDADGNPVVLGSGVDEVSTLEKFDSATGASLWAYQATGTINELFVASSALVIAGSDRLSPVDFDTRGFVERIDPVSGVSQWRSVLASPAGGSSSATSVVQLGDRLVVAGTACALPSGIDSKCTVAFWRASASSNTSADVAQSPAQIRVATLGVAKVGNADSIYAAVSERAGSFAQLRVSRHRKSDGAQVWQKFLPIEANADSWRGVDRFELKLGGDGDPIILLASDSVYFVGHSDARVIKISAGNGDVLWTRELIDSSNGQTDVATFGIASDSSGNVFVPAHERYVEVGNPTISFGKRVLHKLSSSTGASLWQVEFDPHEDFPYYSIPQGYVAGNYYLALESPLPTPQMAWTGIDGATGTVAWSNPDLPIAHPAVIDYSKVVVAVGESELRITRFSPSSGAIVWQTHYDGIFDQNFAMNSGLEDDGAFVLGGSRRTWDFESAFLITRPIVIAIQASNGAIEWVNAFDDFPDARGAAAIKFVADGLVRASRTIVSPAAVPPSQTVIGSELTSLSRLNGSRVGSELLHAVRPSLPHLGFDSNYVISRIEDGNFFTQGDSQIPGSPSQFTISSWNVPSTLQIGSLVVSLSTSVDGAGSNVRYSYSFTTENQGGVTAEQVFALLSLPPDSISSGVICTLNGAPCSTVSTASSIEARVDVAPGSVLVLQGSVEVQGGNQAPHELRVTSFAPPGFVEDDLADNVSTFRFTDKIFRNGFE